MEKENIISEEYEERKQLLQKFACDELSFLKEKKDLKEEAEIQMELKECFIEITFE